MPKHANASQVTPHLWVGGDLEVRNPTLAGVQLAELDALGITDIVDCRLEWSDEVWVTAAMPHLRYEWLGVDDVGQRMPDEWFGVRTEYILRRLDHGGTVLAHCHMGINRGPSMVFATMLALGWDPVAALDCIRQTRPIAHMGYADDALDWWLRTTEATETKRADERRRVAWWRRANHLDVGTVIRKIRIQEDA